MTVPLPGWPDLFVEIAPGDTPLTVSPTWVDVTDTIRWALVCERDEKSSSMRVTWDDPERDLDSANTASPYYPYIRPRLPVRFRASIVSVYSELGEPLLTETGGPLVTEDGEDFAIWRGHLTVPDHSYAPDGDDTSTFDCVDLFAVMATIDTSQRSAWASTIEGLSPFGWWRFGEENPVSGTELTDDVGGYHGVYHGSGASADGLVDGDQSTAVNFGVDGFAAIDPNVFTAGGTAHTFLFRFSCPVAVAENITLLAQPTPHAAYNSTDAFIVGIGNDPALPGLPSGHLFMSSEDNIGGGQYFLLSNDRVDDGLEHTGAIEFDNGIRRLYVDGILNDEITADAGPSPFSKTAITDEGAMYVGAAEQTTVDEYVLVPGVLTANVHADLHEAAVDSWTGETTGDRVARAANLAGIPAGLQDIADGVSTVVGWSGGSSTIDIAQEANETEQGILVVSGDGKLTFTDRHEHVADEPAAVFGDTGSDLTYCGHSTEQGEQLIVNRAVFSSPAGTGLAEDPTSIAVYGAHSTRRTTIDDNRNNLIAGAQHLVARSSGPELRIVGLEIDPMFDPENLWPQVLGREIGDKITVNRTPAYGDPISQDVTIVGIRHIISQDSWRTTWSLTAADSATFAISDVSTSDGPAFAAF